MKIDLDKQTMGFIRNLFFGKEYDAMVRLADEIRRELRNKKVDETNQWSVVRSALANENQAEGIKLFLETFKQIAEQYNEEIKKQDNS